VADHRANGTRAAKIRRWLDEAAVTLEKVGEAWTITAIHLTTRARVPSIDAAKFAEIAGGAKTNCPLSRVLNATITMDAKLGG